MEIGSDILYNTAPYRSPTLDKITGETPTFWKSKYGKYINKETFGVRGQNYYCRLAKTDI